jgi:type II secretory pathway component GspD/PulD (secretin)
MFRSQAAAGALVALLLVVGRAEGRTISYNPKHVPPAELEHALGARESGGRSTIEWGVGGAAHTVEVRRNDPANLLLFTGDDASVEAIQELVKSCDQSPRQIALEARIVEVNTDRARDLGIDWSQISSNASAGQNAFRRHDLQQDAFQREARREQGGILSDDVRLNLSNALHLLESKGAATTRDMPRVITLNNRPATILDGERVTFTTRANSFAQLYVADTMDAGLKLAVLPSLLESGQLRLQLVAELTQLEPNFDNRSFTNAFATLGGSPIKRGQIVENTIVCRDGEPIVLGGFTRTVDQHTRQRFPVLGYLLPFLFSHDIVQQSHHESLITLTPRVVDLEVGPDPAQKKMLEGH